MGDTKHETRAVFTAALALSTPEEHTRYLDKACAGKPELRQRVESLLRAHAQATHFLEVNGPDIDALHEGPGTVIDRYKLLEEIGEGAFGRVFMAEQIEPVCRKVALKIIKAGMDTREVIARFEAERQALALMDHPNIAKVLDAGATETGRPYFVMELVRGVPITDYCEQQQLSTTERLQLFMKVCHAVQHAHQKGIIHRDLKPTNILVTVIDGEAVPKVIDFGVAKALGQKLTEKTLFTAFQQMVGTPAYMSPEQAALSGVDVDTRSDIYSLGVLLYELLTGVTPFDQETFRKAALDEIRRLIRETEPPKPSTRLHALVAADVRRLHSKRESGTPESEEVRASSRRLLQAKETIRLVRGDLDWIVMKCLEKDRARRYETANSLADDIDRHLKLEPVNAAAPSALYRARKFIHRHKTGLAAVAAFVLLLAVGAVVSTWEAIRATRAERVQSQLRQRAEAETARADAKATEADTARQQVEARAYASDMSLAAYSANSGGDLGSVQNLLARWPHSQSDRRGWEWYYLNSLCHRESLTIAAHSNGVLRVAWSPDGSRLASAGRDGLVKIWDASTGRRIAELRGHTDVVFGIAWSPDGQRLASSSDDSTVRIWDSSTGKLLFTLTGHKKAVRGVAWSLDGKRLATASLDRTARIWDAATGAELLAVPTDSLLRDASWNADGIRLAVCSNTKTIVLDTVTGRNLISYDLGRTVSWSPDGRWLARGGFGGGVRLCDAATQTNEVILGYHEDTVLCLSWSSDGTRLASAGGSFVGIWDPKRAGAVQWFRGHAGLVRSVAWRPDGKQIASAGIDGTVKVWDVDWDDHHLTIKTQPGQVISLAWNPKGKQLATGASDGLVRIWELAGAREPIVLHGHSNWVWQVAWNPAGTRLASGSWEGGIKVWEASTGRELQSVQASTGVLDDPLDVRSLAWSPDGKRLASVAQDGCLKVWDGDTMTLLAAYDLKGMSAFAVAWSPDGRQLAAGLGSVQAGDIQILDAATGKVREVLRGHRSIIRSLAWSRDNRRLASASDDATAKVWDTQAGRELYTLTGHSAAVRSVAWSPDESRLATGSWDHTVKIWDAATGEELCSLTESVRNAQSLGAVFAVAWSPDGSRIASSDQGGTILIHDCTPGRIAEEKQKLTKSEQAESEKPPTPPSR